VVLVPEVDGRGEIKNLANSYVFAREFTDWFAMKVPKSKKCRKPTGGLVRFSTTLLVKRIIPCSKGFISLKGEDYVKK
jgi:hypothetical protein